MILFDQHITCELYIKRGYTKNPNYFREEYNKKVVNEYYEKYNDCIIKNYRRSSRSISWKNNDKFFIFRESNESKKSNESNNEK